MAETILEPDLPIVDPHHHLWDRRNYPAATGPEHPFMTAIADARRYLLDELLADTGSGHNVVATVFVECGAFYKADGPVEIAGGRRDGVRQRRGRDERERPLWRDAGLRRHRQPRRPAAGATRWNRCWRPTSGAGGRAFRGIRNSASFEDDKEVLARSTGWKAGLYRSDAFRKGFGHLAPMGLSFDAWLLEPQLPDAIDLARAFPGDHDRPRPCRHADRPGEL